MGSPMDRAVTAMVFLLIAALIDQVFSPITLRGAVAAFNALARLFSPAPPPPKRRLVDGEPVRKKKKKPAGAFPMPTGGQAVAIAALTIAGTYTPGFLAGFLFPKLANVQGWELILAAAGLRVAVQSVILTTILSAPIVRSFGVAMLDVIVRVAIVNIGIFIGVLYAT